MRFVVDSRPKYLTSWAISNANVAVNFESACHSARERAQASNRPYYVHELRPRGWVRVATVWP